MGSSDVPPPHVPWHYHAVCTTLLGVCAILWTLTYILIYRRSMTDRTYGMPLFALAFNFAWELVMSVYVADTWLEGGVFFIWLIIDIGLVYNVVKYGHNEWRKAPLVMPEIGKIFFGMTAWSVVCLWTFSKWWIDNNINPKKGRFYCGVEGPDTTELAWWTALFAQVNLSVMSLFQLVVRGHSGGTSFGIWVCRFLGTFLVQVVYHGYCYLVWPEANAFWVNPFAICLWVTVLVADLAYPFILSKVQEGELILKDGRKVRKEGAIGTNRQVA
ncbi:hypothetical protein GQ43DRAFT_434973 [Delitschia confertaspora ATCC 74209]|uniref:Uncharacterized protein n=1 Tax=Delitschia confertaspora ATCC 74209 TaxID=1513339 RepID=A0A9P4JG28_9PLEO|nr:hypothetical protein GQ43DRAFT_434973 [Delitschia confertaspora ATCC 74209]